MKAIEWISFHVAYIVTRFALAICPPLKKWAIKKVNNMRGELQ